MLVVLVFLLLASACFSQVELGAGRNRSPKATSTTERTLSSPKKPKKKIPGVFVPPDPPNYPDLELKDTSRIMHDPAFIKACKEMAGYYVDPKRDPSLKNTIVISGVNSGYKDFFHNFRCHTQKLSIKFLPISLDEGIYNYLTTNKISTTYLMGDIPGRDRVASEPSGFGGKNFNLIGCRKMEAVYGALSLGYDVIFSDVDIAFLSDPIRHLFADGIDYIHSTNKGCNQHWRFNESMEGNTGFYAVRSNPRTIRTWDLTYRACSRAPLYDDQTMFWLILRTNQNPSPRPEEVCPAASRARRPSSSSKLDERNDKDNVVVSCPLDDCVFSASHLRNFETMDKLMNGLRAAGKKAVMAHANWMNGKEMKKGAMQRAGLWVTRKVHFPIEVPHTINGGGTNFRNVVGGDQRRAVNGAAKNNNPDSGWLGNYTCAEMRSPLL